MATNPGDSAHTPRPAEARGLTRQDGGPKRSNRVRVVGVAAELPVSGSVEERIAQIARFQRGRVARRQLLAAGISSSTIGWLVSRHRLIPRLRGVFAVGHDASTELAAETEALLAVRAGAALSHLTATALWGLLAAEGPVDVVVVGNRSCRIPGVHVHRSRILQDRDIRVRHGLPVVSAARALLDIAPDVSPRQLEQAFDRGIVDHLLKPAQVADVLSRAGGHKGRTRLAAVLERQMHGATMTRSEAEERVLALIRAARLPQPMVNARVAGYELDFYWPQSRFALEVDGYRFHSARGAFERDRRKDNDLRKLGVTAMRTTWWQVVEDSYALVADLAREVQPAGGGPLPG